MWFGGQKKKEEKASVSVDICTFKLHLFCLCVCYVCTGNPEDNMRESVLSKFCVLGIEPKLSCL